MKTDGLDCHSILCFERLLLYKVVQNSLMYLIFVSKFETRPLKTEHTSFQMSM